jgi:hypothetical protein
MNYLVRFRYEVYCQGYEFVTETILVSNVESFDVACECIKLSFKSAHQFENLTFAPSVPFSKTPSKLNKQS